MRRTTTGVCVAAALGFAVTLGAQSTTSTTATQRPMATDKSHDITITGCLSKGADGYILTGARASANDVATTTTPGATTTAGTTGTAVPPATSTTAPTEPAGSGGASATTWALVGGSDLDKHVGHKVQVTGRAASEAAHPATTTASPATTTGESHPTESRMSQPTLNVESVKMIASSCS
jgi:hypothetical protein